ncbi:DNA/RNA non-specific endonuclease [Enterococcus pallens]|uniref:DNA/RNA non-specific endonuclease n=1 Tax=Enterococcus pallens TaxID=160454 RepID=UPI00055553F6|nr:DNA/RNA non-specific endonuclease [Enterococcus pallens]
MAKKRKKQTPVTILTSVVLLLAALYGLYTQEHTEDTTVKNVEVTQLTEIPAYDGEHQIIQLNHNQPNFTADDLKMPLGTHFSDLDSLNRVGRADGMLHKSLFPKEERERLYVKPTGWQQKFYQDKPLYNRAHLIAFRLTGENNNLKNLMTATSSLNSPGMTVYENEVADYLKETGNHVRYRVTPYFEGDELVARGVQMEAQSIEDDGVSYNVFIYNIQEGVTIDYQTGRSQKSE